MLDGLGSYANENRRLFVNARPIRSIHSDHCASLHTSLWFSEIVQV